MNCFKIGDTDFEVDKNSSFSVSKGDSQFTIDIEINGNKETFDSITENEDSVWSWALYAPKFYFSDYPVSNSKEFEIELTADLLDQYDIAIYMMDHCDVSGFLKYSNGKLIITGKVSLFGNEKDYRIEWTKELECLNFDEKEMLKPKKTWWKFWR